MEIKVQTVLQSYCNGRRRSTNEGAGVKGKGRADAEQVLGQKFI